MRSWVEFFTRPNNREHVADAWLVCVPGAAQQPRGRAQRGPEGGALQTRDRQKLGACRARARLACDLLMLRAKRAILSIELWAGSPPWRRNHTFIYEGKPNGRCRNSCDIGHNSRRRTVLRHHLFHLSFVSTRGCSVGEGR